MKVIQRLTLALMVLGTTESFCTPDHTQSEFQLESEAAKKRRPDSRRDRKKNDRERGSPSVTVGPKGEQGEPGPRGEPGQSAPLVYTYYYKSSSESIGNNGSVLFDGKGAEAGGILYNGEGNFNIPEDGDYQITYLLNLKGDTSATFGLLVNEEVVPGSVHIATPTGQSQHLSPLYGSIIVSLNAQDQIALVNLSDATFTFVDPSDKGTIGASITIKKLR